MRKFLIAFIFLASFATSSHAKNIVFHQSQLPYNLLEANCETIMKHANHNKYTKLMAASMYSDGKHLGKRCAKKDYVKAFKIYEEIGMKDQITRILQGLQYRADNGDSFAPFTLRKLRNAGYSLN